MVAVTLTQKELCDLCNPLLRLLEACSQNPDLLVWPTTVTKEDLWKSEQFVELREQKIEFSSYREILLLNENITPFVMNFLLYGASAFEWFLTLASFWAPCIPIIMAALFIHTRKQLFCRYLIMWLSAKTCFWLFDDDINSYR